MPQPLPGTSKTRVWPPLICPAPTERVSARRQGVMGTNRSAVLERAVLKDQVAEVAVVAGPFATTRQ
jgi:hypothetical protein